MRRRIVLLGATGYTGRLVAEALVHYRARPVLAGRSSQNLSALGAELGKGLDTVVADVRSLDSLLALLKRDDVLVSTVGPFVRYGELVVDAAIQAGATYIDSCGEPPFLRRVFEAYAPHAQEAGVALVPGCGFEYVVGSLAAWLALQAAGDRATAVDVGYFVAGRFRKWASAGTRASVGASAVAPHFAWRGGELVEVPAGDQVRTFAVNGSERPALAIGGLEHLTLPRLRPSLRDVNVYLGAARSERGARTAAKVAAMAGRVPGAPATVCWFSALPRSKDGPDETERAKVSGYVTATAYDAEGQALRAVRLNCPNPYTFTGKFLAWAAMHAAAAGVSGKGAIGPVEAFGLASLAEGCVTSGLSAAS